jgi:hypothetical protein
MIELKQAKRQAKALRQAISEVSTPATLTHAQCLDLLARMNRAPNWSTYWAGQHQTYFYHRHEPYLPNKMALVRALSVRKAILTDLSAVTAGDGPDRGVGALSPIAIVTRALSRFRQQASQARKGTLHVAPLLQDALKRTTAANFATLQEEEVAAEAALTDLMKGFESSLTGAPATYSTQQAKAYHAAYLAWRLATFASSVCAMRQQDVSQHFGSLATEGIDLLAYAGALLIGELDHSNPVDVAAVRTKLDSLAKMALGRQARKRAQVLLMAILESGSTEASVLPPHDGLRFSASELGKSARVLREAFPEIAAWQAWVELKPLLAHSIDSVDRSRG